jgi:hypothetical protein
MGPASAPHTPGICEEKAQLECRYREAEDAFHSARTAIRQKGGRLAKDDYLTLARAADLAWDRLEHARSELATHLREHGCGILQEAPASYKPIW